MLTTILENFYNQLENIQNMQELTQLKAQMLGKQSLLRNEAKKLAALNEEDRRKFGQEINDTKSKIETLLEQRRTFLEAQELNDKIASDKLDLTIPARYYKNGTIHPITEAMDEILEIFAKLGFAQQHGPSIETDWHNFTALNIAEDHPARQMHDTFYLNSFDESNKPLLLRTHTSNTQIRTMLDSNPPFKFVSPGRTYRSDSDMTHTPMFHQIEGCIVDKNIHMGNLKYVIIEFIKEFFQNSKIEIRFRPSFFPFTEPSAEVDIRIGSSNKWLEVLGCGMIHPNVLKNVNIDNNIYKGFAFGLGLERFAMLKYNIKDLRQFFDGDLRWIRHYSKVM